MANPQVSKIKSKNVTPIETDLDGWEKLEGNPTMKTWIEYTSDDGSMISGCWEATPGTYHVSYGAWEFVHLIEGVVIITPDGGTPETVGPRDAFVVEKDFKGTWEVKEKVFKHFMMNLK